VLGGVGKGLKVAFSVLNFGRCTLSAGCVGGAKQAMEMCIDRVKDRKQFGRPIAEFHLIKEKIARMAEAVFAMDAITYLAAGLVDRHVEDLMLETAIVKLFCSENAWKVIDDAVQIFGGEGYMREVGLERMLRDARINRIVEGTTEVMTAFISLVGLKGVGEDLEKVLHLAKHPMGNFGRLAQFAKDEFSDVVIGHSFADLPKSLAGEGRTLARLTKWLARDVVRVLGKHREKILDMELVHQHITAVAMDLYAMAAVISKLRDMPEGNGHDRDMIIGKSFCKNAAARVERQLEELFDNRDKETLETANAVLGITTNGKAH
jgi:alkylation response protein AidB-like acyl-CoA dehydrogenase